MSHTSASPSPARRPRALIAITAATLFSMFFGAGNLIFPPVLGAQAGPSLIPALGGFLLSAVALPVLAVLAIAVSGQDIRDLTRRGGWLFGAVFPVLAYLSIGALYGVPRTAAVSFTAAVTPLTGWHSWGATAAFSAAFFAVCFALAFDRRGIVGTLGRYLTPALLLLLAVLVILAVTTLPGTGAGRAAGTAGETFTSGFLQGYLTMDSVAALALGIVVISSLRDGGLAPGRRLVRGVSAAGLIAGGLLAVVYVGLALVGARIEDGTSYPDGATLLSAAAEQTMGRAGMVVFGLIVLLACLTTAVGLLGATSEYFSRLVPAIPYRWWVASFSLIALVVSTLGLESVIAIAVPIIGFLYPAAITLVALALLEAVLGRGLRRPLSWTYVLALAVAMVWSALMTAAGLGWGESWILPLIGWSPGHAQQLGWFLPTVAAALTGLGIDLARGRRREGASVTGAGGPISATSGS